MEDCRKNFEEIQHEIIERILPRLKEFDKKIIFYEKYIPGGEKNMSSDNSNTDNPQSDPSKDENSEPNNLFLYNIKNNRKYILYFLGALIGGSLRIVVDQVQIAIPNSWWGLAIIQILNLILIFYAFIAPFVFGGKETIDELKIDKVNLKTERTTQGKEISTLRSTNNAILVTNNLQSQLLEENGITSLRFKTDGSYEVKPGKNPTISPP